MSIRRYYVYLLSNTNNTVLYIGVTNDLVRRTFEHRTKKCKGFTQKYNVDKLIYYESFDLIESAIKREKQLKGWSREKKIQLVDSKNPKWLDLHQNNKIQDF
jgi:putative endonuclease